jgi:choloylglycine hydrolase
MNEKGLAIDETNLVSVYEPGDGRPGVSCAQWIQYQLDNFATVGEVIEHLDDLRLDGEGWHFLVADADGRSAVLEFPGGEIKVITGGDLSVSALTNTTHEQAMSHVPMDAAFGGELDIATGSGSYGRFVKMAAMIRDYDPARDGKGDDYAFRILEAVRCENTLRSVVYDAGRGRVSWTTPGNRERRWLDFANLDLTLATPTRMVDVEAGGPGNVAGLLEDYTTGKNRMIVDGVLGKSRDDRRIVDKLAARGMTVDEAIERIVNNPVEPVGMKRRKP